MSDETINAILNQYEQDKKGGNQKKGGNTDLRQYFSTFIPKGQDSGTKKVRILPAQDGGSPFTEVFIHTTTVDGNRRKFPCLEKNFNEECPFCEAAKKLYSTGNEEDKQIAKDYNARKFYVAKVIDRDDEEYGPKFWRFPKDFRSEGVMDKIIGIIQTKETDISDPETGRDLTINIGRDHNENPVVQTIVDNDPSPLSSDENLKNQWLNDERTWKDVYAIKDAEYLSIVVKGETPYFDKSNGCWTSKEKMDSQEAQGAEDSMTLGGGESSDVKPSSSSSSVSTSSSSESPSVGNEESGGNEDDDSDDLPF